MSQCIICGKTLKTGRKYCYLHRGYRNAPVKGKNVVEERKPFPLSLIIAGISFVLGLFFIKLQGLNFSTIVITFVIPIILVYVFFRNIFKLHSNQEWVYSPYICTSLSLYSWSNPIITRLLKVLTFIIVPSHTKTTNFIKSLFRNW